MPGILEWQTSGTVYFLQDYATKRSLGYMCLQSAAKRLLCLIGAKPFNVGRGLQFGELCVRQRWGHRTGGKHETLWIPCCQASEHMQQGA